MQGPVDGFIYQQLCKGRSRTNKEVTDQTSRRRWVVGQQQLTVFLGGDAARLSAVDELRQDLHESEGFLNVREVARSLDDLKLTSGNRFVRSISMAYRDDVVSITPDDQCRHPGGEIEPIHGAHRLSTGIYDCTKRADKGLSVLRLGQRRIRPPHLDGPGVAKSGSVEKLNEVITTVSYEAGEKERQCVLDARGREKAQKPVHLSAQTPTTDEDEPITVLRELVGELHGDAAAKRLADHGCPSDAQDVQEVAQYAGLGAQGIVARRFGGSSVADQVRRDNVVLTREQWNRRFPGLRAASDPMNEQDGGTVTGSAEAHVMAVNGDVLKFGVCRRTVDT